MLWSKSLVADSRRETTNYRIHCYIYDSPKYPYKYHTIYPMVPKPRKE